VREVLRGIRHMLGTAPRSKTPATAELIARMLAACPTTLIGRRDRALIAVGFAGAFRRSELLALDVADLTETGDGLRVVIRRSKTDPDAEGQEVAIPRGTQAKAPCSARSPRPARSAPLRLATTASSARSSAAPPPLASTPPCSPATRCAPAS
jgi:integrase